MINEFHLENQVKLAGCDTLGEKGTVIALHGLTGNHKTFYHYRKLLQNEYRFINYDLRGRGNSSPAAAQTSLFQHAEDLKAFIAQNEIERPILIGYSMGAYICAQVASEIDVEALILLDGAGKIEERQRGLIIPSLSRLEKTYKSPDDYVAQTRKIYESLDIKWDEIMEDIARYEVKKKTTGYRHKSESSDIERDFNSLFEFNPKKVFEKISCPILLVIAFGKLGEKESLFTKETYIETISAAKDITTIEVPANHYTLLFEKQSEVEASICTFLNNL